MERHRITFDELIDQRLSQVRHEIEFLIWIFFYAGYVGFSNDC
jgi:hypothetical protein